MNSRPVIPGTGIQNGVYALAEKHGLLFHTRVWTSVYREGFTQYAILNKNDDVIGAFSLYSFRKFGATFIISPPYMPGIALFCETTATSVTARHAHEKEVAATVAAQIRELRPAAVDIQLGADWTDVQPFVWRKFQATIRYTYLLDLTVPESQLWDNLSSEKRKSIRKAEKDGLVIGPCADMQVVLPLVRSSLARSGVLVHEKVLENILNVLISGENGFCYCAWQDNKPVSAAVCAVNRGSAVYIFGGYGETKHHGAGVASMWACIGEAKRRGLGKFDFEGSMDANIERYFREFGGTLTPYPSIRWSRAWLAPLLKLKGW